MATVKIRWTRLAVEDLDSAYDYIAETNPTAARTVTARISSALKALKAHPMIGRKGRVEGTGELVVPTTPYIIAYRLAKARVEILAVIHGGRRGPDNL